jgi:hypothetical protein
MRPTAQLGKDEYSSNIGINGLQCPDEEDHISHLFCIVKMKLIEYPQAIDAPQQCKEALALPWPI